MRHIYHYFARIPNGHGAEYLIDGILNMSAPILTMDAYKEVKKMILDDQSLNNLRLDSVTIKSLSLLQTIED